MKRLYLPSGRTRRSSLKKILEKDEADVLPSDRLTLDEWYIWCENVRDTAEHLRAIAKAAVWNIERSEESIKDKPFPRTGRRRKLVRHGAEQFYIKMLGPITVLDKLRDRIQLS